MQQRQLETQTDLSSSRNPLPEFCKLKQKTIYSIQSSISIQDSISVDLDKEQNKCNQLQKSNETSNQVFEIGLDQQNIDESIYKRFQLKVLSIFFINWAIVCLIVVIVSINESLQDFMKEHNYLFYLFLVLLVIIIVALYCYNNIAKRVPYNYLVLFGLTAVMSYLLGYLCSEVSKTSLLLISGFITLWIIFLFIYAFKTKTDITYIGSALGYGPIAVIVIIICSATCLDKIVEVIIGLIIAGIISFFLVYDLQKLRGKFHKQYEIDDYIIAALNIYLEVIMIFKVLISTFSNN